MPTSSRCTVSCCRLSSAASNRLANVCLHSTKHAITAGYVERRLPSNVTTRHSHIQAQTRRHQEPKTNAYVIDQTNGRVDGMEACTPCGWCRRGPDSKQKLFHLLKSPVSLTTLTRMVTDGWQTDHGTDRGKSGDLKAAIIESVRHSAKGLSWLAVATSEACRPQVTARFSTRFQHTNHSEIQHTIAARSSMQQY